MLRQSCFAQGSFSERYILDVPMQNSLQDCSLNHFQFDCDTDAVYVRLCKGIYASLCV